MLGNVAEIVPAKVEMTARQQQSAEPGVRQRDGLATGLQSMNQQFLPQKTGIELGIVSHHHCPFQQR